MKTEKEEVKSFLFARDIIIYSRYSENSTIRLLNLVNTSSTSGYKSNTQNQ